MFLKLKQLLFILTTCILMCCISHDKHDYVVFENDARNMAVGFVPTTTQIKQAENALLEYLTNKTKTNQTIYYYVLDEKVPLQNALQYYNRRYFGQISTNREKIITIEYVFARCGGNEEWKQLNYTDDSNRSCWWSVQYNIDNDSIYHLMR